MKSGSSKPQCIRTLPIRKRKKEASSRPLKFIQKTNLPSIDALKEP